MMRVLPFLLTVSVRWLAALRSLCADARAAYKSNGARAALFEVEMRGRALYALALGAPVIFGELLDVTRESEGLRAAWRAGVAPETYVRRRCEGTGIAVGSPTYMAVLSWSWSLINFWERDREAL
jgi:hypothetical protein